MKRIAAVSFAALSVANASICSAAHEGHEHAAAPSAPSAVSTTFEKLKSLDGEWIDVDGTFGPKGDVAVVYRVTGGGSAVIETHFPGKKYEMTTVFYQDGSDLALTHYCAYRNQPRMRAKNATGNHVVFEFDGGANLEVSKDLHMHRREMELISANETAGQWDEWMNGRPDPKYHKQYRLVRKTAAAAR